MSEHLEDTLRLGIIQTTIDMGAAWSKSLTISPIEEAWVINEMQQHLAALSREFPKPEIVLLPELSVPLGFVPRLRRIAAQMNAVIIAGLDFQQINMRARRVVNRAAVIIPDGWGRRDRSKWTTLRFVGKTYPAWPEAQHLKKFGYKFQSIPEVWVFEAEQFGRFAVVVCFDVLDLDRVAMYRLAVQHLFVVAYNQDIQSFDHAAEALARMVYCNVVVCNTGAFGGSIVVSPYKGAERRLVYRHTGMGLSTSQTIGLPVRSLIVAQTDRWPKRKPREFKSLPPGSDGSALAGVAASTLQL